MTARDLPELPHPDRAQVATFEGADYVLIAPEDYEAIYAALAGAGAVAVGYIWPSAVDELQKGEVSFVHLWARPTGQAGLPLFTHPAPVAVGVDEAQINAALDTKLGLDFTLRQLIRGDTIAVGYSKVDVVRALIAALEAKPHA
jgi:hypothetical protein